MRIKGLDGLRAVAVAMVIVAHLRHVAGAPGWLKGGAFESFGAIGVDLFFCISGFIITLLLLRERAATGRMDLGAFWARRFWRIVPPLAAYLLAIKLLGAAGVIPWNGEAALAAVTFTANLGIFNGDWFHGHTWSLSVEEQFYLAWPLLLALLLRSRVAPFWLAGGVVSGVAVLALQRLYGVSPVFGFLPHVDKLAAGCLLAMLLQRFPLQTAQVFGHRWAGPVLLAGLACAVPLAFPPNSGHRSLAMILLGVPLRAITLAAVIGYAALSRGRLAAVLEWKPVAYLGGISYGLYLWQQLFLGDPSFYLRPIPVFAWPLCLFAALACAALSHHLLERPIRRMRTPAPALVSAHA